MRIFRSISTSFRIALMYFGVGFSLFCSSALGADLVQARDAEVQVVVKGVATPFSVFGLVNRLGEIPGVEHVSFDLSRGLADVRLRPGATVTDHQFREAIRDASYTPGPIRRTPAKPGEHGG